MSVTVSVPAAMPVSISECLDVPGSWRASICLCLCTYTRHIASLACLSLYTSLCVVLLQELMDEEWTAGLLSAYYAVLLTGSSLIVCFWAEVSRQAISVTTNHHSGGDKYYRRHLEGTGRFLFIKLNNGAAELPKNSRMRSVRWRWVRDAVVLQEDTMTLSFIGECHRVTMNLSGPFFVATFGDYSPMWCLSSIWPVPGLPLPSERGGVGEFPRSSVLPSARVKA